jgi:rhamnosyltransferase
MMGDQVCAIIVTYNPDDDFAHRVSVLRSQVDPVVVVDNKSTEPKQAVLRQLAQHYSFTLLENPDNLGIGTALNRGIHWALAQGFEYLILFDQDSEITEGFVAALVSQCRRHLHERVAVVAPQLYNRNTGARDGPRGTSKDGYLVSQTSGSLMPAAVFRSEGWFREDLFIDYVDYEYCLRVVNAGWRILYCQEALLSHSPGQSCRHVFWGIYLGTTMNYSALRHYYSTRNGVWVLRQYWKRYPRWCAGQALDILKNKTKVLVFEKNWRAKLESSLCGLRDGLKGNLGKRQELEEKEEQA